MKKIKKIALVVLLVFPLLGLFGKRDNPPVENTVQWDSPQTQELFYTACADCHSNETKWPWYSYVAPTSWLVRNNVNEGREHFNISLKDMGDADEAAEEVSEKEMPPNDYLIMHQDAKLSEQDRQILLQGLIKTFGQKEDEDNH